MSSRSSSRIRSAHRGLRDPRAGAASAPGRPLPAHRRSARYRGGHLHEQGRSGPAGDVDAFTEPFRMAGYPIVTTSARDRDGLDELLARLQGKVSAFAGPSGVGKSSLLNAIARNACRCRSAPARSAPRPAKAATRRPGRPCFRSGRTPSSPTHRVFARSSCGASSQRIWTSSIRSSALPRLVLLCRLPPFQRAGLCGPRGARRRSDPPGSLRELRVVPARRGDRWVMGRR